MEFYQRHIRVLFISSCRFIPSCSDYARQAVGKYGCIKGGALAIKRIFCCHPFSRKSGYDPLV
ncbi:MAG: membrane protein insertion efficiency factor YidD [Candidatus Omnitrophica bacterium]|nr:membrane protein insertion efficiency factor YidD [Candidatus Omnitrophota bacterium]